MRLEEQIKEAEQMFPMAFLQSIRRNYGILYYDDGNKKSHDSNHAILFDENIDLAKALTDIKEFYLSKGISPRVNHPFQEHFFEKNKTLIESLGFEIKTFDSNRYMFLSEKNTIKRTNNLTVRRVTEWDKRIATDIFIPAGEEYEVPLFKRAVKDENCHILVGYRNEEAVSVALFHTLPVRLMRIDYVITAVKYRRYGYARELVSYLVEYCRDNGIENCYQWPANSSAEKIYYEAGFRTIFEAEAGVAVFSIE